jgi:hypothetical protein
MSKGPRDPTPQGKTQFNQTYDLASSVGIQKRSDKPSKPLFSMAKQSRDKNTGIFKSHMEFKPMQIRI